MTGGVVAVNHDARDLVDDALRTARLAAYPPGEFVGQESFMRASEVRQLAERARIGPGSRVLDLCCGAGGPGVLIAREFGCSYYGVDASASAVRLAQGRARDVDCHFDVAQIPPLPAGGYDVVLLFETMLAFPDKRELFGHVAAALPSGGRFVFTVEEGEPLSESERASMPDSGTVGLTPLAELHAHLQAAGLQVTVEAECTRAHQEIAQRLYDAFRADAAGISARLGPATLESLLSAHRLWSDWLRTGRVRKFAIVAER